MAPVKCPECGAGADLTADGEWAHCASCNNIFEPKKVSGSGGEEGKKDGGVEAGTGQSGDTNDGGTTGEKK